MAKPIPGFDYVKQRAEVLPRKEWRARLAAVVKQGGRRRVENGETFAHDRNARIVFEVYTTLPQVEA